MPNKPQLTTHHSPLTTQEATPRPQQLPQLTTHHSPLTTNTPNRTELLIGTEAMARLRSLRVILFGVGGVGSWAAECLIRSGVGNLTIVDVDNVEPSNLNRQLMALHSTLGQPKVEALRNRLLDINPQASITAIQQLYTADTASQFPLDEYDYVLDCIDSLAHKATLILNATASKATLLSSMGAALKLDPQRVRVSEFWQVDGCPLAATLRKRFRRAKKFPTKKFQVVYSDEVLKNIAPDGALGSCAHITALFGMTLAGLLVQREANNRVRPQMVDDPCKQADNQEEGKG